jgi:site-specific recombinase XerC
VCDFDSPGVRDGLEGRSPDDPADPVLAVHGKGNKDRAVPIRRELLAAVDVYLVTCPAQAVPGDDPTLFVNAHGRWLCHGSAAAAAVLRTGRRSRGVGFPQDHPLCLGA